MIFKFIKSYRFFGGDDNFELDIPVGFNIPNKFTSLNDLGLLSSNNEEVCMILDSMGINKGIRHSYRISKNKVSVSIVPEYYDRMKKKLLREYKLKQLGL